MILGQCYITDLPYSLHGSRGSYDVARKHLSFRAHFPQLRMQRVIRPGYGRHQRLGDIDFSQGELGVIGRGMQAGQQPKWESLLVGNRS